MPLKRQPAPNWTLYTFILLSSLFIGFSWLKISSLTNLFRTDIVVATPPPEAPPPANDYELAEYNYYEWYGLTSDERVADEDVDGDEFFRAGFWVEVGRGVCTIETNFENGTLASGGLNITDYNGGDLPTYGVVYSQIDANWSTLELEFTSRGRFYYDVSGFVEPDAHGDLSTRIAGDCLSSLPGLSPESPLSLNEDNGHAVQLSIEDYSGDYGDFDLYLAVESPVVGACQLTTDMDNWSWMEVVDYADDSSFDLISESYYYDRGSGAVVTNLYSDSDNKRYFRISASSNLGTANISFNCTGIPTGSVKQVPLIINPANPNQKLDFNNYFDNQNNNKSIYVKVSSDQNKCRLILSDNDLAFDSFYIDTFTSDFENYQWSDNWDSTYFWLYDLNANEDQYLALNSSISSEQVINAKLACEGGYFADSPAILSQGNSQVTFNPAEFNDSDPYYLQLDAYDSVCTLSSDNYDYNYFQIFEQAHDFDRNDLVGQNVFNIKSDESFSFKAAPGVSKYVKIEGGIWGDPITFSLGCSDPPSGTTPLKPINLDSFNQYTAVANGDDFTMGDNFQYNIYLSPSIDVGNCEIEIDFSGDFSGEGYWWILEDYDQDGEEITSFSSSNPALFEFVSTGVGSRYLRLRSDIMGDFTVTANCAKPSEGSVRDKPLSLHSGNNFTASLDGTNYLPDSDGYYSGYFKANLVPGDCQAVLSTTNADASYYGLYDFGSDSAFNVLGVRSDWFTSLDPNSPITFNFLTDYVGQNYIAVKSVENLESYSLELSGQCTSGEYEIYNTPSIFNVTTSTFSDTTSVDTTIPVEGDSRLVLINVAYRSHQGQTVSSVKSGVTNLTKVCRAQSHEYPNEMWYLLNPPQDTDLPIQLNFSTQVTDGVLTAMSLKDVNQSSPIQDFSCEHSGGAFESLAEVSLSPVTDNLLIGGVTTYSGNFATLTSGNGLTELWNRSYSNTLTAGVSKVATNGSPLTLNWAISTDWPWSASAVAVAGILDDPAPEDPPGTGENINNPYVITPTGTTFNFADNSDGVHSYGYFQAPVSGKFYVETYDAGGEATMNTLLDYFYTDSAFNIIKVTNDDFIAKYSRIYFTANSGSKYYFRVSDQAGTNGPYGIKYHHIDSDDLQPPEFELLNLGSLPTSNSSPTWTGWVTDDSGVASLAYAITDKSNVIEVPWTEVTPDDGEWGGNSETFTFTSPELTDGVKNILVRTIDTNGNVTDNGDGGQFTNYFYAADRIIVDAIDTMAPTIQVYDVVPNPTVDRTPKIQGRVKDNITDNLIINSDIAQIFYKIDSGNWILIEPLDGEYDSTVEAFSIELPELALGDHSVFIRAIDAAGNDTNETNPSGNKSVSFTIVEPDPNIVATTLEKNENFLTQDDLDFISGENYVWGNGQLRLSEVFEPNIEPIITDDFGHRYQDDLSIAPYIAPSATNGYWMVRGYGDFYYWDRSTNQAHLFNVGALTNNHYSHAGRLQEIVMPNGDIHVWITSMRGMVGINFGNSITDRQNDKVATYGSGSYSGVMVFAIDQRQDDYGIYFASDQGLAYYRPKSFLTTIDDQVAFRPSVDGWYDNITALHMDQEGDALWIGDYSAGMARLDDAGTPLNQDDDEITQYEEFMYRLLFSIGQDKNGGLYFGGDIGLYMFDSYGDPEVWGDEIPVVIITNAQLGFNPISFINYLPGEYPVGSQFFLGTRNGDVNYISINDTPGNLNDDQIIRFSVSGNVYPSEIFGSFMLDYETMVVAIRRMGIYEVKLNRDFAQSGFAESQTDARIEGRLDVDFITLADVRLINSDGSVTYQVSNDGGVNWFPITVGETVNFPTSDYRIKFRINMIHGSTPIIGGYDLTYASYPDPENRGSYLGIIDVPATVTPGGSLGFKVVARDDLDNPVEGTVHTDIELRRASDNQAISFEPTQATIIDGSITIVSSAPEAENNYRIYAYSDTSSAYSEVIKVARQPDPILPAPSPTPAASPMPESGTKDSQEDEDSGSSSRPKNPKISIRSSEDSLTESKEVLISWDSSRVDQVELRSQYINYGLVDLDGQRNIYVDKDTTFWVTGKGPRGEVTASTRIAWSGDSSHGDEVSSGEIIDSEVLPPVVTSEGVISTQKPVIEVFEVLQDETDPTLLTIKWRVSDADYIEATMLGGPLSAEGSSQAHVMEEEATLVLTARNEAGEATMSQLIKVTPQAIAQRLEQLRSIDDKLTDMDSKIGLFNQITLKLKNWFGSGTNALSALLILMIFSFLIAWLFKRRKKKATLSQRFPVNQPPSW